MKLIVDWREKRLKCHFCGTDLSVKYQATIDEDGIEKEVCACNRCIFLHVVK